jgi:hypothetical protein
LPDRTSNIGLVFLLTGVVVAAAGYLVVQSIPIAGFGFALSALGALALFLASEVVPQDAYRALLDDSIANIEIVLEESQLQQRAVFIPSSGAVRAVIPVLTANGQRMRSTPQNELEESIFDESSFARSLQQIVRDGSRKFIANYENLQGLVLVPPGNEIVKLSKISSGTQEDLEEALQRALISFTDLARSVLVIGTTKDTASGDRTYQNNVLKVQIRGARVFSESPFFNQCFGSPVSCVATCVACFVLKAPVKILDERIFDPTNISLTLEILESEHVSPRE